ncbi:hypothetical protein ACH42_10455 [Endozoicomonas sp. (ex Bugula neritina AB1)]|nr:hypothetical protein ACH42_10455 [Endozoicomonas sp. (ex Bugula neritina AB1)]
MQEQLPSAANTPTSSRGMGIRPSLRKYTKASEASQSILMWSITQPENENTGRSEGVAHMTDPSEMSIHLNQSFPEGYFCCNPSLFISQPAKELKIGSFYKTLRSRLHPL